MAIIEIHGGPINHRYLMKKSKDDLASMYMRLLRDTEHDAKDAERYRWLRDKCNHVRVGVHIQFSSNERDADAAIDAAMRE